MNIKSPNQWMKQFGIVQSRSIGHNRPIEIDYALVSTRDIEDIQRNVCQYFFDKYGYTYPAIPGFIPERSEDIIQKSSYNKRKVV